MTYFVYSIIVLSVIRAVSFGIYTLKSRNISGGVAIILLSLLSLVAGFSVFY